VLSLTSRPTTLEARHRCAVETCPLVNDCDLVARFCDFYLPLSHLTTSMREILSSYRVHIWCGKTRMAGLQSGESRMMIDSVVWAQYITVTHRQPRRHSKYRANTPRLAADMAPNMVACVDQALVITARRSSRRGTGHTAPRAHRFDTVVNRFSQHRRAIHYSRRRCVKFSGSSESMHTKLTLSRDAR